MPNSKTQLPPHTGPLSKRVKNDDQQQGKERLQQQLRQQPKEPDEKVQIEERQDTPPAPLLDTPDRQTPHAVLDTSAAASLAAQLLHAGKAA